MKKITLTLITVLCAFAMNAQIVINEIMYNIPGAEEKEEFIELLNTSTSPVDISNWSFSEGMTHTFPANTTIASGQYFVLAKDSAAFHDSFGFDADDIWGSGTGLSNSGEDIVLVDDNDVTIDSVDYDDNSPWPTEADSDGHSLQLCDPSEDNSLAQFWKITFDSTGYNTTTGIDPLYATPGQANNVACVVSTPTYTISQINSLNPQGEADSLDVECEIYGIVHCQDWRGGTGLDFVITESSTQNVGIRVFSFSDVDNYVVAEGDEVRLVGKVAQFKGNLQFAPDTIEVISTGNATVTPTLVTDLDESTENKLVEIKDLTVVDATEWTGSGSGFNVNVSNGTTTMTMRIDNDSPLYSQSAPTTTFDIIGLGGQYDGSSPYIDGYQVLPCGLTEQSSGGGTSNLLEVNGVKFNVFPNPVSQTVNVEVSTNDVFDVQIVNLTGKVVLTTTLEGTTKIDVSELSAGFYSINLIGKDGIATTRLIKQ